MPVKTILIKLICGWALMGGALLLLIVALAAINAAGFSANALARVWGGTVSGLPGYEDAVQMFAGVAARAMLLTGILGTWVLSLVSPFIKFGPSLLQFKTALWNSMAHYDLSVVPLFVLIGFVAAETGLSRDLFQALSALTRKVRDEVAMATILAWARVGAVSGSSIATASTTSRVALPELRRLNYDEGLSSGVLAAGGTLGILIPPSVALVIYAIIVEAPTIDMFQAAIILGILAVIFFLIVIRIRVVLNPDLAPDPDPMSDAERRRAVRRLQPLRLIFGSIILGFGIGLFTPTSAAGVGVFLILVCGLILRGISDDGLTLDRLKIALLTTAKTASMIYFILFSADILNGYFARADLPATLSDWAVVSTMEPYMIFLAMLVILIVLGGCIESMSMIFRGVAPFFAIELARLGVLILLPILSLYLTRVL